MDLPNPDGTTDITYRLWPFWTTSEMLYRTSRATALCVYAHSEKKRKYTGLPYFVHCFRVAFGVASYPETRLPWVNAALLHDTVEDWQDTPFQSAEAAAAAIVQATDQETLNLVLELTNVKQPGMKRPQQKEFDRERLRKASRAAKIIKMHDRIDNLHDFGGAKPDFKKLYLNESRELLKVLSDADPNLAWQLETLIDSFYKLKRWSQAELEMLAGGTMMEHKLLGPCHVEQPGPGGYMRFTSEMKVDFADITGFIRETGESK